jgi:hypothetical protein
VPSPRRGSAPRLPPLAPEGQGLDGLENPEGSFRPGRPVGPDSGVRRPQSPADSRAGAGFCLLPGGRGLRPARCFGRGAPESPSPSAHGAGSGHFLGIVLRLSASTSGSVGVRYAPLAEASGSPARRPEYLQRRSAGPAAEAVARFPGVPGPGSSSHGRRRSADTAGRSPWSPRSRYPEVPVVPWPVTPRPPSAAVVRVRLGPKPAPALVPWLRSLVGGDPCWLEPKPGPRGSDEDRTVWVVTSKTVSEELILSVETGYIFDIIPVSTV